MCCEKALKPVQLREQVETLEARYNISKRRACSVLMFQRSTYYYRSVADKQAALRLRIRDLAQARVSYDYRKIHVLLEREGWEVNHKRIYRLYKQEGLLQCVPRDPGDMLQHTGEKKYLRLKVQTRAGQWTS